MRYMNDKLNGIRILTEACKKIIPLRLVDFYLF